MATTPQAEGALLDQKPAQTIAPGKEGPNGSLEVNGHTSPAPVSPTSMDLPPVSESKPNGEDFAAAAAAADAPSKNVGAFSANTALPV
jgi:bromodomain-containing factor 1